VNNQDTWHSVSVAGVITDDHGRALLIQRRDNHRWEPPGGVLELGETIPDGLRREVREETGLEVEPVTLTGVYKNMKRAIVLDALNGDHPAAVRHHDGVHLT
jgi:8-oxo-dGTP diphosphatase